MGQKKSLEEIFNNVMEGVRVLDKAVMSAPAKARREFCA